MESGAINKQLVLKAIYAIMGPAVKTKVQLVNSSRIRSVDQPINQLINQCTFDKLKLSFIVKAKGHKQINKKNSEFYFELFFYKSILK